MIIVDDPAIVFYHNAKTAGNAINFWFLGNIPGSRHVEPQHLFPSMLRPNGWSFCVVRNPWDRWVSWWYYWKETKQRIDVSFEEYTVNYWAGKYRDKGYGKGNGQWGWIGDQYEMSKDVDCVLRYENLLEDFKIIQEKLSCYKPLPLANINYGRKHYTRYYTSDELIEIIAKTHKRDIDAYGYQYAV